MFENSEPVKIQHFPIKATMVLIESQSKQTGQNYEQEIFTFCHSLALPIPLIATELHFHCFAVSYSSAIKIFQFHFRE